MYLNQILVCILFNWSWNFLKQKYCFQLKRDSFWVNMELFNSKWSFSSKFFFQVKEILLSKHVYFSTKDETRNSDFGEDVYVQC